MSNESVSNKKGINKKSPQKSASKYSGIIIAISLFLIFNLSVLALNYYTAAGVEGDAVSINLSGRQRMLSQRTAKILLGMQYDAAQARFEAKNVAELNKVVGLFDTTLIGFRDGGMVTGGNEKPVFLKAVTTAQEKQMVADAIAIWQPYKALVEPLMANVIPADNTLDLATDYARANNLTLLKLMNDLTTSLEISAKAKSAKLQLIQTIALVLSLIFFANIVFNALRKLRASDNALEKTQRENAEILSTVKEGLFLLDSDLNIGSQFSNSLSKVLQKPITPNMPFMPILEGMTSPETYQSAQDYITLLFGSRVKENLVMSLNPLSEVKVISLNGEKPLYLSFQFNRVVEDKVVLHLLVTVQDVTEQITQAQELLQIKGQSSINVDMLHNLLENNQLQIDEFLKSTDSTLTKINELLAAGNQRGSSPKELINQCFRGIHSIKGEAATLGMVSIETSAHIFEKHLVEMRDKARFEQTDILSLPIKLTDLFKQVAEIRTTYHLLNQFVAPVSAKPIMAQSLPVIVATAPALSTQALNANSAFLATQTIDPAQVARATITENAAQHFARNMQALAERVGSNQQKQVQVKCNVALLNILDAQLVHDLQQVSIQLVRNAIVHGIEPAEVRTTHGKNSTGLITIECKTTQQDGMVFSIKDDGQGIVPAQIKASLLATNRYSQAAIDSMSDEALVSQLFEPGFSTAVTSTVDAGHGVGLDIVQTSVKEFGGELSTRSVVGAYTEFVINLPMPALNAGLMNADKSAANHDNNQRDTHTASASLG